MPHPLLISSQSDYLIWVFDRNSLASSEANWSGSTLFANARFPLSCDPLRTPRLAIRSWSWNFLWNSRFGYEVMRVDMFWYDLLRSYAIHTICQFQVSRSVKVWSPVHIRSHTFPSRIVAIESTSGSRSDTIITIGFPESGRSDTCKYVPICSSRTDVIRYYSIRLWSRSFSRSWSRVIKIWATTGPRRVYIQLDWLWTSFDSGTQGFPLFAVQRRQWLLFFFFFFVFFSLLSRRGSVHLSHLVQALAGLVQAPGMGQPCPFPSCLQYPWVVSLKGSENY